MSQRGLQAVFLLLVAMAIPVAASEPDDDDAPNAKVVDMKYIHHDLGNGKHLMTLVAQPNPRETRASLARKVRAVASKMAARTCPGGFEFITDDDLKPAVEGGTKFVFVCK